MMRINNLCVSFASQKVLDDISLEIGDGITCIMAESGRGKTTLLNVIAGLLKPESGTIENGPKQPSVMFQEDRLFPWFTALENVEIVCNNRDRAAELLNIMELGNDMDKYPKQMSGGMKRRVALARALANESDMLILDEPFKGLDEELRKRIIDVIKQIKKPMLIATHDESDVELLDAVRIRL